jgi:lipid A 3-O-deacylase
MKHTHIHWGIALAALFSAAAHADWRPDGYFVDAAAAPHGTHSASLGLVWNGAWRGSIANAQASYITEAYLGAWSYESPTGRRGLAQVGLQPLLRLRGDQGQSPWYFEAGIGLSATSELYQTTRKTFSTRFNFKDTLGFGRSIGSHGQEIGLRVTHFSNAGVSHPNPGENFLQLRYAAPF